jgi:hypothetical protein
LTLAAATDRKNDVLDVVVVVGELTDNDPLA